jgi:hypothetical protein
VIAVIAVIVRAVARVRIAVSVSTAVTVRTVARARTVVSVATVRVEVRARIAASVSTAATVAIAVIVRAVARARSAVIVAIVGRDGSNVRSRVRSQLLSSVQRKYVRSDRHASPVCSASRLRRRNGNVKSGSTKARCVRKPRMLPAVPERAARLPVVVVSRRSLLPR